MRFFDYVKSIDSFAKKNGMVIEPLPRVVIDKSERGKYDPLAQTATYRYDDMTITLFIDKRHVKDILRSFCHELVHHSQYLADKDFYVEACNAQTGKVEDGSMIEKLEADAYERGNLLMRKWTENFNENMQ